MPSSIRAFAIRLGGGLRPPSDGRRAPDGALLPASPHDGIAAAKPPLETASAPARRWWIDVWVQILRRKPRGTDGGVIVVLMLAGAVLADVISPYGYAQTSLRDRFIAMSAEHWLGTDQLGRDLLTRLLYGARVSLYVGFGAVALGSALATLIGVASGYVGGRFD